MRHLPEIAALITLGTASVIGVGCAASTSDALDQEIVSESPDAPRTEAQADPMSAADTSPAADQDAKKAAAPEAEAMKLPAPVEPEKSAAPEQSPEPSASMTAPEAAPENPPPPVAQAPHAPAVAWDALASDEDAVGRAANVSWWGPNGACTRFQRCVYYRGYYTCSRAFPQLAKTCGSGATVTLSIPAPPVFLTTPLTLPYLVLY